MRRFFLAWPTKGIFQTPSEKSPTPMVINDIGGNSTSILVPPSSSVAWSAYVRLLSVKNPEARTSTRPKLYAWGGPSDNWIAKSAANSTNASHSHRIKPPCWRSRELRSRRFGNTEEAIKDPSFSNFSTFETNTPNQIWRTRSSTASPTSVGMGDDFAFLGRSAGFGRRHMVRIDSSSFIVV